MFQSLWRYIKAVGYLITGQIDKMRSTLDTNPNVMRANYDEIINQKKEQINEYKNAVAGIITIEQKKKETLKSLVNEIEILEKKKAGAVTKAKSIASELSEEETKQNEDYNRCLNAFKDFSSTLKEKQARADEIENDLENTQQQLKNHKRQLENIQRSITELKQEKEEAIADVISAKHEKEIADVISGISQDTTADELSRLREARTKAKVGASISQELAKTDAASQDMEFLEYANTTDADDEFESLMNFSNKTSSNSIKLPE